MDRRGLVVVTFLCAALFACSFAIGRAASSGSGAPAEAPPSIQVAFAGTVIPLRLSSAPPIQMQAAASSTHPVHAARSEAVSVPSVRVRARPLTAGTTPPAQAPVREAAPAPAPAPQPPASAPPAGAPASAPASGAGQSKPHTSTGTSFDSSG